jgi:hypothetical protein
MTVSSSAQVETAPSVGEIETDGVDRHDLDQPDGQAG